MCNPCPRTVLLPMSPTVHTTVAKVSVIVTVRNLKSAMIHRRAFPRRVHRCSTHQDAGVPLMVLLKQTERIHQPLARNNTKQEAVALEPPMRPSGRERWEPLLPGTPQFAGCRHTMGLTSRISRGPLRGPSAACGG